MSTRGIYGIRKNGKNKITYNHCDSYPGWLGNNMLEVAKLSLDELNKIFDDITLVEKDSIPTKEQIRHCKKSGTADFSVNKQSDKDWYCLLRNTQGHLEMNADVGLMIDYNNKDKDWLEYGYLINLDENAFEVYSSKGYAVGNIPGMKLMTRFYLDDLPERFKAIWEEEDE